MNHRIRQLAAATCLATSPMAAVSANLFIAIDRSGSNVLLHDQAFADEAARFVHGQVLEMKEQETVWIVNFGARYERDNLKRQRFTLSRRFRAPTVASKAAIEIQKLPGDEGVRQGQSSILDWLELTHGFNCAAGDRLVLLTDGLESSETMKASDLLAGQPLPAPERDLTGCTVTFFGLGAGMAGTKAKVLRRAWKAWVEQAGGSFSAIVL